MIDKTETLMKDGVAAVTAGSAPLWVIPIAQVNEYLTTVSLVLAIVIAGHRIFRWAFPKEEVKPNEDD